MRWWMWKLNHTWKSIVKVKSILGHICLLVLTGHTIKIIDWTQQCPPSHQQEGHNTQNKSLLALHTYLAYHYTVFELLQMIRERISALPIDHI